ncbi:hypothetical protein [Paenibacillus sp. Z3-2]
MTSNEKIFISTALIITVSAVTALSMYASSYDVDSKADNPNYPDFDPEVKLSEEEIKRALENVSRLTWKHISHTIIPDYCNIIFFR